MGRFVILSSIFVIILCNVVSAAIIKKDPVTIVMDFGTHKGAATNELSTTNVGKAACDYIIERLVESKRFKVVDREGVQHQLETKGIVTVGIIDPDKAKYIAELLNVQYIIYGNVSDLTLSDLETGFLENGVKIYTVTAHIIARILDVNTGEIVMMAKGEGKSKSSFTKVGSVQTGYLSIGNKKVTQDSVHNSIQKAAYSTVDQLIERLYGVKPSKKK